MQRRLGGGKKGEGRAWCLSDVRVFYKGMETLREGGKQSWLPTRANGGLKNLAP